ncbi:hypothetical protein K438DRAFT_1774603 [Mycena galopus ATCC 62051]|nr:hypothetical protein K438DRAFT_1774603 [Mycena galopus ATCC 62051]
MRSDYRFCRVYAVNHEFHSLSSAAIFHLAPVLAAQPDRLCKSAVDCWVLAELQKENGMVLLWATLFSVLRYFHSHLKTVKLSQNSSRESPAGHWILFLWGAAGGVVEVSLGFLEKAESARLRVMLFHGICFG